MRPWSSTIILGIDPRTSPSQPKVKPPVPDLLIIGEKCGLTLLVDLVIALTIILAYMCNDAREQGISAIPYLLLTLAFGSVGPLLYLIRRLGKATARLPRTARTSNA